MQYIFGGRGTPLSKDVIAERKLRRLLRLLDAVASYRSPTYNPLTTIAAVNALHPLGKHKALAVVEEYLRVRSNFEEPEGDGAFFVLRALFDVPASGSMPPMMVGAPSVPIPTPPTTFPRFPLAIIDDIPFVLTSGYSLAGMAERPERHLAFFKDNGTLRAAPLRPPDNPLAVVDRLVGKPGLAFATKAGLDSAHGRVHIMNQGLRMVDSVYRPTVDTAGSFFPRYTPLPAWREHLREAGADMRFEVAQSRYTRSDGSTLAKAPRRIYRRAIWPFRVPGAATARVVLERVGDDAVRMLTHVDLNAHQVVPTIAVRVLQDGNELHAFTPLANEAGNTTTSTMGTQHGALLTLAKETPVVVEATVDGTLTRSQPLMP